MAIWKMCEFAKLANSLIKAKSLVSAALSAGYSDQSHFTHWFKCFLGVTSGQYVGDSKFLQDQAESKMGNLAVAHGYEKGHLRPQSNLAR